MPALKIPTTLKRLSRVTPGRGHGGLRGNDRHFIAHHQPQGIGQFLTENDAETAGAQIVQRTLHHLAVDIGNLLLLVRQNP